MGNISFVVPTENRERFTLEHIKERAETLGCNTELLGMGQLIVNAKDNERICEIWMTDDVYLLDNIDEENDENSVKLQKANLLINNHNLAIGVSYGVTSKPYSTKRSELIAHLLKEFKGYWLDEGIHPEFIHHADKTLDKYL
jgi:hypothetical protein